MAFFVFSFVGAFLAVATLPLVLELFLLTFAGFLPKKMAHKVSGSFAQELAVIIPAHNEEGSISACVESLTASATPGTRLLVIAHNCTDKTAEIAHAAGAEVLVYDDPAARGKGYALHFGFERALAMGAGAVLVIDADSAVSANLVSEVRAVLASGADALQCRYEMSSGTQKATGRLAALALRGFNVVRPAGRQRLGLSAGILGNGFAIRSEVLSQIPYNAFSVVEDLEYHIHLVQAGKRVQYLENALVTASLPQSQKGETIQRSRWEGGRIRAAKMWFLPLLRQVLQGRLRLIEPMLDVAGLPIAYGVFALLLALLVPADWVRLYAVASLLVVFIHVLAAAAKGPDFWGSVALLATAPFYILWKIRLVPGILRGSSAKAAWVRTQRGVQL